MKKMVFALIFLFCVCPCVDARESTDFDAYLQEEFESYDVSDVDSFLKNEDNYNIARESFSDTVQKIMRGEKAFDIGEIFAFLMRSFLDEAYASFSLLLVVLGITLMFSLLKNMGTGVTSAAFFVCAAVVATFAANAFGEAAELAGNCVRSAATFVNVISPVLTVMLASGGATMSAASVSPIMLFGAQSVVVLTEKILIPLLYGAGVLYIADSFNEKISVRRFADFMKKTVKWGLCLMLTVFVGVLGIQSFCAYTLDGAAAKGAKFVFSTAVPVVGGILSDTIETVAGCSHVVKNATGIAGVVVLLIIAGMPIIKILASCVMLHIGAAIAEPIAQKRVSDMIGDIASVISLMAGIVVSTSVIFIVSMGAIMCLGTGL